jgi:hypothetical protein
MGYVTSTMQLGHKWRSTDSISLVYSKILLLFLSQLSRAVLQTLAFLSGILLQSPTSKNFLGDLHFRGILGNMVLVVRNLTDGFDVLVY